MTKTITSQPNKAGRAIIINVDDLGLSTAVNSAVLRLAGRGLVGATSFMAGGVLSTDEVQALDNFKVDVGLHVDFTEIFPTHLKRDLPALIRASYLRQLNTKLITEVIRQQFDAFEAIFQRAPVFIDGHQHIHQLPIIRQCLMNELVARYGQAAAAKHPTIKAVLPRARVTTPLIKDAKSQIIYRLGGKAWQQLCEGHQVATNDYFAGVYDFKAERHELKALWQQWLSAAPTTNYLAAGLHMCQPDLEPLGTYAQYGSTTPAIHSVPLGLPKNMVTTLIMCHPAVPDSSWNDEIKTAREREFAWLMSTDFEHLLEDYQVRLVKWSEIAA
ncbi:MULTISPECIES: ChbG/HpnK family deacetylase [Psychrobacter]|uniref:ChbG/HpnK family deacetylase n=1 Tax=Psychrobacter TaxID=497 RepID=UPI00146EEDFF|nr:MULTISPECIES: ChbG/HpnK family deacetylase [Psychrobacter]